MATTTTHCPECDAVLRLTNPRPGKKGKCPKCAALITIPDVVEETEEIQPRAVHLVLHGTFDGIYRTVATLSQQQQLFLPDRWDIAPASRSRSATKPPSKP